VSRTEVLRLRSGLRRDQFEGLIQAQSNDKLHEASFNDKIIHLRRRLRQSQNDNSHNQDSYVLELLNPLLNS